MMVGPDNKRGDTVHVQLTYPFQRVIAFLTGFAVGMLACRTLPPAEHYVREGMQLWKMWKAQHQKPGDAPAADAPTG